MSGGPTGQEATFGQEGLDAYPVTDLRAFLTGRWSLSRVINDRRRGEVGRYTGTAEFVDDGVGLEYRETGTLSLGDYEGEAVQQYLYRFPSVTSAEVSFGDGRFFHSLDLTAGTAVAVHHCGDDRYDGTFTVEGAGRWRVIWNISGPRKDLTVSTVLDRG